MVMLLVAFDAKPEMTTDEFRRYYRETHAPIVADLPNIEAYEVLFPNDPDRSPYDGVALLRFSDKDGFAAAMESDAAERMDADAAEFVDQASLDQIVGDVETFDVAGEPTPD